MKVVRYCLLTALFSLTLASNSFSQISSRPEVGQWVWFGNCIPANMMEIDVLLDGKTIYRKQFSLCRTGPDGTLTEKQQRIRAFHISGGHTLQGVFHTKATEQIEGNIWMGAASENDLVLGVSFATKRQVLLNALHILKPHQPTESELDSGVLVRTFPLPQNVKAKNNNNIEPQ
ncbi:MAG TPA: hypothetical protein VK525_15565 [Candidatus Saccharimonadales bacterium]|nr:hypothetical protein [Candidatus Saccharimonadales bacterium]